jgi:lipopolysaccharide biosynthesis glycosyltransferase
MLIPVILASDENYAPYMATAMQSVMENACKEQKYAFIILYKTLSEETLEKLKQQVAAYPHFSVKFIDVSSKFEKFSPNTGSGSWPIEACFRLIAPWLLEEYDKVIYMDCDIICNSDISRIYGMDIGDNLMAGALDIHQISIFNNPKYRGKPISGIIDKMDNPENYINSGFILMNTMEFRKRYTCDYLLSATQSKEYKFPDQDLLNFIAQDSVFILPQEFNFLNCEWDISHAPRNLIEEYCKAKENPKIIHYTSTKPWKVDLNPLYFHLFWKYSTRTPFIDSIISAMIKDKLIGQRIRNLFMKAIKKKLKGKL